MPTKKKYELSLSANSVRATLIHRSWFKWTLPLSDQSSEFSSMTQVFSQNRSKILGMTNVGCKMPNHKPEIYHTRFSNYWCCKTTKKQTYLSAVEHFQMQCQWDSAPQTHNKTCITLLFRVKSPKNFPLFNTAITDLPIWPADGLCIEHKNFKFHQNLTSGLKNIDLWNF